MRTLAILMAGGAGTRLTVLSDKRAKPAVPFAGKYKIIDFTLSNCVNSGIYDVAVLTQYRPLLEGLGGATAGEPCIVEVGVVIDDEIRVHSRLVVTRPGLVEGHFRQGREVVRQNLSGPVVVLGVDPSDAGVGVVVGDVQWADQRRCRYTPWCGARPVRYRHR